MAHAHPISSANGASAHTADVVEPRTLEDLAALPSERLAELYAQGRPPQLGVLSGPTRGALLSVPLVAGLPIVGRLFERLLRAASRASWSPWRGKVFAPSSAPHRTSGRNRIYGIEAFPFDAHVEKSALDHDPTLVLRYDRPENPPPLRILVDELREVARGLYLGPAYYRGPNGPVVLLWWAAVKA